VELDDGSVRFSASRSSGPGGQNVNKRSTKVELRTVLDAIPISEAARTRLARLLGERLTDDGEIVIVCDEHRSQRQNREGAIDRLSELVRRAMVTPKRRIATKPSRGSKERRLTEKKQRGETKKRRGTRGEE
jgi:ribosome-associated protein